jgi:hypothetical protein
VRKDNKHEHLERHLERFSDRIVGIEAQKQRSVDLYAGNGLANETYVIENRNLDRELERLRKRKKASDPPPCTGSCRE